MALLSRYHRAYFGFFLAFCALGTFDRTGSSVNRYTATSLNSTFKYTWGPVEGIIWWVCLAVAIFIFWNIVQQSFTMLPSGSSSPFVYFGLSGGTALILAVSGSLRLAQHTGILVAIFAASWMLTLVLQRSDNRRHAFPLSASPVVTLVLTGIWMLTITHKSVKSDWR